MDLQRILPAVSSYAARTLCIKKTYVHLRGATRRKGGGSKDLKFDGGAQYEIIEELLDKRSLLDGDTIYLCRWKGMDPSQDTWEPSAHILCKQMIEEFENEWRK